jgi:hypothetical protein
VRRKATRFGLHPAALAAARVFLRKTEPCLSWRLFASFGPAELCTSHTPIRDYSSIFFGLSSLSNHQADPGRIRCGQPEGLSIRITNAACRQKGATIMGDPIIIFPPPPAGN